MPTKSRSAVYMRVSTAEQKPDLQLDDLRAYADRAGLEIVREYLDVAVSGRKQGRPQLDALMQAARDHAFECILVWKFDRFGSSRQGCESWRVKVPLPSVARNGWLAYPLLGEVTN